MPSVAPRSNQEPTASARRAAPVSTRIGPRRSRSAARDGSATGTLRICGRRTNQSMGSVGAASAGPIVVADAGRIPCRRGVQVAQEGSLAVLLRLICHRGADYSVVLAGAAPAPPMAAANADRMRVRCGVPAAQVGSAVVPLWVIGQSWRGLTRRGSGSGADSAYDGCRRRPDGAAVWCAGRLGRKRGSASRDQLRSWRGPTRRGGRSGTGPTHGGRRCGPDASPTWRRGGSGHRRGGGVSLDHLKS